MAARLNTHVDGVVYGPDSEVPDDVAARITNPDVWDGDPPAAGGEGDGAGEPARSPRRRTSGK